MCLLANISMRNKKPPAMRVTSKGFNKEITFRYNRGVQATIEKGKVISCRRLIVQHIQNGYASTI